MDLGDVVKVSDHRPRPFELVGATRRRAAEGKRTVWVGRQKAIEAAKVQLDADSTVERFGPFRTDDGQGWIVEWRPAGAPCRPIAFAPRR